MNYFKTALLSALFLGTTWLSPPAFAHQQKDALVSKTAYDATSQSFTVTVQESVGGKAIKHIDVAIWSEEDGQDDLKWQSTSEVQNGQANVHFQLAHYGYRAGKYITHVYTTYQDGSRSGVALEDTLIAPKAPQVSLHHGAIQMTTDVYAPSNGTLYYAVWSEENNQDDIKWYPDTGTGLTRADLKNHSGYGRYFIHTYLAQNGQMIGINGQDIIIEKQMIAYEIIPIDDKHYDVMVTNVPEYMTAISVPTWSDVNGQDDLKWHIATKIAPGTYRTRVYLGDHGFDSGSYSVHLYGENAITNAFEGLAATSGFRVDGIAGLESPTVAVQDSNQAAGTFKVTVSEKPLSKKVSRLRVQVNSKSHPYKAQTYETKPLRYGYIEQVVDVKGIQQQEDTFSVLATVTYSDNSEEQFGLADQVYKPQSAPRPKITTYMSERNTYPVGQCTWAVKSLAPWIPNWLGNAGAWAGNARAKGFRTGSQPRVGAIAVWPKDGGGYGHVAYVTEVASPTRIQVKEANYAGKQYISNFRGWFNPLDTLWGGQVVYIYPD